MQKIKKYAIGFVCLSIIACFSPYFFGILIEKNYRSIARHLDQSDHVRVVINDYQRGFFSSTVDMQVMLTSPYLKIFQYQDYSTEPVKPIVFNLKQHIYHGPLFLHPVKRFPYVIGLASIANVEWVPVGHSSFLQWMNPEIMQKNNDYISLRGRYVKQIYIPAFELHYPQTQFNLKMDIIQGEFIFSKKFTTLSGQLAFHQAIVSDDALNLMMPNIAWQFSYQKNQNNLWTGKSSLTIETLTAHIPDDADITIEQFKMRSLTQEINNLFATTQDISAEQVRYDTLSLGPLRGQLTLENVDAEKLAEFMAAYKKILTSGELYKSQLKEKIQITVPALLTKHSQIRLDHFSMDTPSGALQGRIEIHWPNKNNISLNDMDDVMDQAEMSIFLRAAKPLVNEAIKSLARSPYFFRLTLQQSNKIKTLDSDVNFLSRQNNMLLVGLVESGILNEKAGLDLLELQKSDMTEQEYKDYIKALFLSHQVSFFTAHLLYWNYWRVISVAHEIESFVNAVYSMEEQSWQDQLNAGLKQGYIQQDDDQYIMSARWRDGKLMK